MAADNLNCLYEMNEFVRDDMIAMSMVDGMAKEACDGLTVILGIISHDLKVISDNL